MERFPQIELNNGAQSFFLINKPLLWREAQGYCEFHGMRLAQIPDYPTNVMLMLELQKRGIDVAWIGLSDAEQEGDWRWTTGEPVSFANWQPGEPNNSTKFDGTGEDYAALQSNGFWNDLWGRDHGHRCAFLAQMK